MENSSGDGNPFTCLLRNMYAGQEAIVRTGHGTMDWFQIGKGVRQGCMYPCVSSVQLISYAQLFVTPWTATCQASLSITNSQSLLKLMSIESVMPPNHLILSCPLLLPSVLHGIRVFSNESVLHIRWPKFWSFSFSISPSNEYSELISFRIDWLDLLAVDSQWEFVL